MLFASPTPLREHTAPPEPLISEGRFTAGERRGRSETGEEMRRRGTNGNGRGGKGKGAFPLPFLQFSHCLQHNINQITSLLFQALGP